MVKHNIYINVNETAIPGYLNIPDSSGPHPAIIFANGYCAYHEMYDAMAEKFCEGGFVTLEYDNRGYFGTRHGHQLCGTEWLDDVSAAIGYIYGLKNVDNSRIGLTGVSMGGAVTIIQTSRDPRIKCAYAMAPYINGELNIRRPYITLNGRAAWDDYLRMLFDDASRVAHGFPSQLFPENTSCFTGAKGKPDKAELEARKLHPLKVSRLPMDSILNVYLHVDALLAAKNIHVPTLIVHGTGDNTLDYKNSSVLFDAIASEEKEYHLIEGADHVLPEVAFEESTKYGLDWFLKYL